MWRILITLSVTLIGISTADLLFGAGDADPSDASKDFGNMVTLIPSSFKKPSTVSDVAEIVQTVYNSPNLTLAARGNGHSLHGQAMANGGVVIDMQSVDRHHFQVVQINGSPYVEVPGGALWVDILGFCLPKGLSPRCFTDYLNLTVGGTISNAGVGGHAFRYGPLALNVGKVEVVTGKGEVLDCSKDQNSELFRGVLGGLGQFGVITKAWIRLHEAADMAVWIRVLYSEFEEFTGDAESLVGREEGDSFDYVEGFVISNSDHPINGWPSVPMFPNMSVDPTLIPPNAGPVLYCLELALHYKTDNHKHADFLASKRLRHLKFIKGLYFQAHVKYEDYILRVNHEVSASKSAGTWQAPHPWLNLFISKDNVSALNRLVFNTVLKDGVGGRILFYPLFRTRWGNDTSLVIPESGGDVFYVASVLRFNRPFPEGPSVGDLIRQNNQILEICKSNQFDYKLYLSNFDSQKEWRRHFGSQWDQFARRKACFDPKGILAPEQHIFSRSNGDHHGGGGVC